MKSLNGYLEVMCTLEKNKYMLQQMVKLEKEKITMADNCIRKLQEQKRNRPEQQDVPSNYNAVEPVFRAFFKVTVNALKVWGVVLLILAIIAAFGNGDPEIGETLDILMGICIVILLVVIGGKTLTVAMEEKLRKNEVKNKQKYIIDENQKELNIYMDMCEKNDKNIVALKKAQNEWKKNITDLGKEIASVDEVLTKYYSLDIIYDKYRNFYAICRIAEYMISGRCISLLGPGGAYDTYEKEYRDDLKIEKLDEISSKIDKSNTIFSKSMQEINSNLQKLNVGINMGFSAQQRSIQEMGNKIEGTINNSLIEMRKNETANAILMDITNTKLEKISEYEEYQAFAKKQERLDDGRWT